MTPLHDIAETAAALGQDDLAAQVRGWAVEVERLQKNDARYSCVRSRFVVTLTQQSRGFLESHRFNLRGDSLDAAIDAEMAKDTTHAAYMAASQDLGQGL